MGRGRPRGSTNKPKPNGASAPGVSGKPPTTDHAKAASKSDMTDEQLHGLTRHHAEKYRKALEAKKAADAALKNICKLAKSEGVVVRDIKLYLDLDTEEGQERLKEQIEAAARIARWRGADLGTQFSLFDEAETNSFQQGKEAGLAGAAPKPPAGRDVNEWMRGYGVGQAANLARIKQQKQADADDFDANPPAQEARAANDDLEDGLGDEPVAAE